MHDDERDQDTDRQAEENDCGRAQVKQKYRTDQRHNEELLDELALQGVDRALDEVRAVVGHDHVDAIRQAALEFRQTLLDHVDGLRRVLTPAHDDDAADDFAFAVELGDAAAHLRTQPDLRDVREHQRRAFLVYAERDVGEVLLVLQVAGRADHVLGFAHLDDGAAGLLVAVADRVLEPRQWNAEGAQLVGIDHDLVLAHHAADRRHLGDARHRLQLVLQEPVLQAAQLREVVLAGAVHERVLEDPADAGCVGSERRLRILGELPRDLAQVLEHPRAGPVEVGAVLEDDVHVGIAEERIAAHRERFRHGQHRRRERIGDLVLDHLRRLAGERRLDDDLHVREIRQGIDRRLAHRVDAPAGQQHGQHHDEEAVGDRPADDRSDHCARSISSWFIWL